ncbi:MAG: YceI family protein [Candidatus Omnitrophica bacterium]|nr:YceI family protein [Candidatus Omnitrophota bacterium]
MKKLIIILMTVVLGFAFAGTALAGDSYKADKVHSTIGFAVSHLMVAKVTGTFNDYDSDIQFNAKDLTGAKFDFVIKTASIDTKNEARDKHLKSADFFEAEKYPDIIFKTKEVVLKEGNNYDVAGTLTMKGVTKDIKIPVTVSGPITNPMSNAPMLGVEAHFQVNRQEYGLNWNKVMDNGGVMVGNNVDVNVFIEADAVR